MFKIIVDSTADIPNAYSEKYAIQMIPMMLYLDGVEHKDKVTLSVYDLYQGLRENKHAKTSQPNPADVYDAMTECAQNGMDVLFITLSVKLSGTFQTITMIGQEIQEIFPSIHIAVVDSKGGAGIPALMAIEAGKLRDNKVPFDQVIQIMKDMADHAEHIFTIHDLKYLIGSGRINKTEAMLGNLLHVKPILIVDDGEIKLLKKVRGKTKSLETIADLVEERIRFFPEQMIAIMHADDIEVALTLQKMIFDRIGEKECLVDIIGSTLGSHLGIGGVGVFFFNQKPKIYF